MLYVETWLYVYEAPEDDFILELPLNRQKLSSSYIYLLLRNDVKKLVNENEANLGCGDMD